MENRTSRLLQYGGPDGELGASIRYLSQRYAMPYPELKGLLTDIGVEELGHLEMIGTLVYQLTRNLSENDPRMGNFAPYFTDHGAGVYPVAASGAPWTAAYIGVKADPICDLTEDLAAEAALAHRRSQSSLTLTTSTRIFPGCPTARRGAWRSSGQTM